MHSDDTMTIEQVAELAGVGKRTILRACDANELSRVKVQSGRTQKLIFNRAEVERWMVARKEKRVFVPSAETGPAHSDNEVTAVTPRYGTVTTQRNRAVQPDLFEYAEIIKNATADGVREGLKASLLPPSDAAPKRRKREFTIEELASMPRHSISDAAWFFSTSEKGLRQAIKTGELLAEKDGHGSKVWREDVEKYLRNRKNRASGD